MPEQEKSVIPRIGVALSSGGVRGVYAHTGFMLGLQKMGINIQAIAGCSAGAIVGGIHASGKNIQDWADALTVIEPKQFWRPNWLKLLWSLFVRKGRGYTGISSSQYARNYCINQLRVKTFEECIIPFYALAKNLDTGCKTVFHKGELAPRIIASAAVPLLYEPVEIDNEFYCDGALLELAPTDAICCKHQLDILIIHHVAQRHEGIVGFKKVLKRPWTIINIINMLLYQRRPWYLSTEKVSFRRCPCGCNAVVIILEPDLPELLWPMTDSGPQILQSAMEQSEILLNPYLTVIKSDASSLYENFDESELTAKNDA